MRALGERSGDPLIAMNTYSRYLDCGRGEAHAAFSVLAHPYNQHIEGRALLVHT